MMIFRQYFYCNYIWTAEKLKSLLKKIKSPTVERELFQISNNIELLFVLNYFQFENVHVLTVGEIIIHLSINCNLKNTAQKKRIIKSSKYFFHVHLKLKITIIYNFKFEWYVFRKKV